MLRAGTSANPSDLSGAEEEKELEVARNRDSESREKDELSKEVETSHGQLLWLLLYAATAECITTCFVPVWTSGLVRLNVSATALNIIGGLIEGLLEGYLVGRPKLGMLPPLAAYFRASFLGVFTSFPFMVDHAGDLSAHGFLYGSGYMLFTISASCVAFLIGRAMIPAALSSSAVVKVVNTSTWQHSPSLSAYLIFFVAATTLTAAFGPRGFVRDPTDPQFIGPLQVADGEELVLGMFMSCSAVLVGAYISTYFPNYPRLSDNNLLASVDWGCLVCNAISCLLVTLAYGFSQLPPAALTQNLLVQKFVSSFCGSLSSFNGVIAVVMKLWTSGHRQAALINLNVHILTGLLFIPYLLKKTLP